MQNIKSSEETQHQNMKQAFMKNQMDILFFEDIQELHRYIVPKLQKDKVVSAAGSVTLFETGLIDLLRQSPSTFLDRYEEGLSFEQIQEKFRQSFSCDLYFTSTNALTEEGCLYNVDGNGNRVAAMIYGPKEVYVIAGKNKICANEIEALQRIRNCAAPKNAIRLKKRTPCTKTLECQDCMSPDRICSSYVKLGYQGNAHRIKILIINQELGY